MAKFFYLVPFVIDKPRIVGYNIVNRITLVRLTDNAEHRGEIRERTIYADRLGKSDTRYRVAFFVLERKF